MRCKKAGMPPNVRNIEFLPLNQCIYHEEFYPNFQLFVDASCSPDRTIGQRAKHFEPG